jgi:hypothetical protein
LRKPYSTISIVEYAREPFVSDDALKADANPAGLVSCSVRV